MTSHDFGSAIERLEQLEDEIPHALERCFESRNTDELVALLESYRRVKHQIMEAALSESTILLPDRASHHVRKVVQKLMLGEKRPIEEMFAGTIVEDMLTADPNFDRLEELAWDHFFPWFSHYEYITGMLKAGLLVARVDQVPPELQSFLQEVKQCFAFQQYLAVCALCRTAIEIALRHLCNLEGFFDPQHPNYWITRAYYVEKARREKRTFRVPEDYEMQPSDLRELLRHDPNFQKHYWPIRDLYKDLSGIVHGTKDVSRQEALGKMRATLSLLHELYEV